MLLDDINYIELVDRKIEELINQKYAERTINNWLAALRVALEIAFERKRIAVLPKGIRNVKESERPIRAYTKAELKVILDRLRRPFRDHLDRDTVSSAHERSVAIYLLSPWFFTLSMLYLAMRPGEILALKLRNFNLDIKAITVERFKTHSVSYLRIDSDYRDLLNYWIHLRKIVTIEEYLAIKEKWDKRVLPVLDEIPYELMDRPLIPNRRGEHYQDETSMTHLWSGILGYGFRAKYPPVKISLPPVMYHLRHTAATNLLRLGVDLKTVSIMMGHKKTSTTDRYTGITSEMIESAARKLEGFLTDIWDEREKSNVSLMSHRSLKLVEDEK